MSNPPVSLLQRLLQLADAKHNADGLRFIVATAEGLRCLRLDEALKLLPEVPEPVAHECAAGTVPDYSDIIKQLTEQLEAHNQRQDDMAEAVSDLQLIEWDTHRTRNKDTEPFKPEESTVLGTDALLGGSIDRENVAVGLCAGIKLEGAGNTIVGPYAAADCDGELMDVTAVGHRALSGTTRDLRNVTALGAYSHATGDDQVVLGNHLTNVHTLNAAHRRSDPRDMFEAKPLELGLDFVLNVTPIQYQTDFRDAYIDWASKPIEPDALRPEPQPPTLTPDQPGYQPLVVAYRADKAMWDKEAAAHVVALEHYHAELGQWIEDNQLVRIRPDGTHRGERLHAGFNAMQITEVLERMGVNSAIVQDHSINGGQSVKTHSDSEMLAILWRAVIQLAQEVRSGETVDRIASALVQRHANIAQVTQASEPVSSVLPAQA